MPLQKNPNILAISIDFVDKNESVAYASNASPVPTASTTLFEKLGNAKPLK